MAAAAGGMSALRTLLTSSNPSVMDALFDAIDTASASSPAGYLSPTELAALAGLAALSAQSGASPLPYPAWHVTVA